MRELTVLDWSHHIPKRPGKLGLLLVAITVAHAVLFFAPELYLPFDMKDLFLLGYGLVIADSGAVAFIWITLVRRGFPTAERK